VTLGAAAFEQVQKLVYARAAIVLDPGKEYLVESRLAPIARARGFRDVDELCARLEHRDAALIEEVVEAMTTNETSFFRDHHPFEALRRTVLPELIGQRQHTRTLRVWCAACSTGQEPYSLAMLLDEHFPALSTWNVSIRATDIAKSVLDRAKSGRYRQIEVNRGLSARALVRYFLRDGLEWEIRPEIKRRVQFEEMNLIGTWPRSEPFDLVFLRNVLIYFDQMTRVALLHKTREVLRGDGYLLLGGSETTPYDMRSFERVEIARAGVYRACQVPGRGGNDAR
jgi:chemotaxis protein methyltransferase CheR